MTLQMITSNQCDNMLAKTWIEKRGNFPKDLPIDVGLNLQRLDLIRLCTRLTLGKSTWWTWVTS